MNLGLNSKDSSLGKCLIFFLSNGDVYCSTPTNLEDILYLHLTMPLMCTESPLKKCIRVTQSLVFYKKNLLVWFRNPCYKDMLHIGIGVQCYMQTLISRAVFEVYKRHTQQLDFSKHEYINSGAQVQFVNTSHYLFQKLGP